MMARVSDLSVRSRLELESSFDRTIPQDRIDAAYARDQVEASAIVDISDAPDSTPEHLKNRTGGNPMNAINPNRPALSGSAYRVGKDAGHVAYCTGVPRYAGHTSVAPVADRCSWLKGFKDGWDEAYKNDLGN